MSEDVKLNAYFERIGFSGSIAPTLQTLETLHALQPAAIPFENLNSLCGLMVPLDQASLNQKLLVDRRGGYCFELNQLFLRTLRELGFDVRGHLATVLISGPAGAEKAPDHMLMTVDVGGMTYLADVGFGGLLLTAPLKLRTGIEQETALGTYRLSGDDPAYLLEFKRRDEDWRRVYTFTTEEVPDETYADISDSLNARPDWFFRQNLLVERAPPTGRRLLFNTRLTTTVEGEREVANFASVAELRDTLATVFGINIVGVDGLDEALAKLLDAPTDLG